jgi:ABC-type iron transport system FetAB ATPase subunit
MNLEQKDGKYILVDLDYEMINIVINGIKCERSVLIDKISNLTSLLFQNYSEENKEIFRNQLDYLKQRNDEINETIKKLSKQLEDLPI